MIYYQIGNVVVRSMEPRDIDRIPALFEEQGWDKPRAQYVQYYEEERTGVRRVLVADWQGEPAGYVTLWPSVEKGPFAGQDLPEICDFNVFKKYQRRGIGGKLLDVAEALAAEKSEWVTLGVGLYPDYGVAQRMYVRRGYVPDGSGIWQNDRPVPPGAPCVNDDDLVLYLKKRVRPANR